MSLASCACQLLSSLLPSGAVIWTTAGQLKHHQHYSASTLAWQCFWMMTLLKSGIGVMHGSSAKKCHLKTLGDWPLKFITQFPSLATACSRKLLAIAAWHIGCTSYNSTTYYSHSRGVQSVHLCWGHLFLFTFFLFGWFGFLFNMSICSHCSLFPNVAFFT